MLEQVVSSALRRLTLLEKALHSSAPWSMSVGAERVRAERRIVRDGVIFHATFSVRAGHDVPLLSLWHGEELVDTRSFTAVTGDDTFSHHDVEWYIRLGEAMAA